MDTNATYELEAEADPGRWAVLRREISSAKEAKRYAEDLRADYKARGVDRKVRAVKVMREIVA